jgi:hypothetical protein
MRDLPFHKWREIGKYNETCYGFHGDTNNFLYCTLFTTITVMSSSTSS